MTLKDQLKCGDYIKRTFDVVNTSSTAWPSTNVTATPSTLNSRRILTVTQYYYPEWPDKDTPSTDPMSILHLIRDVNMNHPHYQYPIVVHCSAGVGRTGTYITLDAMMEKIDAEGKIDIFGFISQIRERRQYLVQTSKQYVFIHEALYEYCLYGFTDMDLGHIVGKYRQLNEPSTVNAQGVAYQQTPLSKTRLQIEFEKLSNAFVPNLQAREAFSADNKHRNRNLSTICYDDNRVKLSTLNGSPYINATKVKGYELDNELIITQDPMENTVFEFIKMLAEFDCRLIVSLNKEFELEKQSVYWPNELDPVRIYEADDQRFVLTYVSSAQSGEAHWVRTEFEIAEHKHSITNKFNVVHLMYNEYWPENGAPKSRKSLFDLVVLASKEAADMEHTRLVVHAHGGGSNCALFACLFVLYEQFRTDQRVDVCRTVKKLKSQRPHMIETCEQYELCYKFLLELVALFNVNNATRHSSSDSFYSGRQAILSSNVNDSPVLSRREAI